MLILLITACSQSNKHAHTDTYTCPMHPTVVQDKPGSCPVCGMDLVLTGKQGEEVKFTALNYLLKPVNSAVISSIKTVTPIRKLMDIKTKANGVITYDMRAWTAISSRFAGRVEKLFIRYNFQSVKKGQKILEIYSPELLTAQRDLLYLLKSDKENSQLIDGAREKLRLFGVSNEQISQLISTGKESTSFGVYSPVEGYVTSSNETAINQNALDVREGMYVTAGQLIFNVANPKRVWAEFDLYGNEGELVGVGDPVQIKFHETKKEVGAYLNFVQPFYKDEQRFTKVRVYLSNERGDYHIGQLVSATFNKPSPYSMWIPLSAQLDLGATKIAFLKKEGIFQPQEIITGSQSGKWIEVLNGIDTIDSIAYDAHFMIDSESFIKIKK